MPICIAFRGIRCLTTVAGMCVREKDRQTLGLVWTLKVLSPSPVTHLLQQGHTS